MGSSDPWVVIQHVAFEGPGSLAPAVRDSGHDLRVVRTDLDEALPAPDALAEMAGLVVMGGPMGVHDDLAWLEEERKLLRAAVEADLRCSASASGHNSWPRHWARR